MGKGFQKYLKIRVPGLGKFWPIGRILAYFLWMFSENYRSCPNFLQLSPRKKLCLNFDKILDKFWAIFSQTNLVALLKMSASKSGFFAFEQSRLTKSVGMLRKTFNQAVFLSNAPEIDSVVFQKTPFFENIF
jgi:hypothetical protein